jgi:hypothetical protein
MNLLRICAQPRHPTGKGHEMQAAVEQALRSMG